MVITTGGAADSIPAIGTDRVWIDEEKKLRRNPGMQGYSDACRGEKEGNGRSGEKSVK